MLPEDDEFELREDTPPVSMGISAAEARAGRAVITGLLHTLRSEQAKSNLYFTLIPLAFTVGLLLGYYISFTNL